MFWLLIILAVKGYILRHTTTFIFQSFQQLIPLSCGQDLHQHQHGHVRPGLRATAKRIPSSCLEVAPSNRLQETCSGWSHFHHHLSMFCFCSYCLGTLINGGASPSIFLSLSYFLRIISNPAITEHHKVPSLIQNIVIRNWQIIWITL